MISLNWLQLHSQKRETIVKTTGAEMCLSRINEMVFILDDDIHKCYKGSAHNCLEFDTP